MPGRRGDRVRSCSGRAPTCRRRSPSPRPPSTYDGRTTSGKPILAATSRASGRDVAVPLGGCGMPEVPEQLREPLAILRQIDRVGRGAEDADARPPAARSASLSGVWPPNWTTHDTSPPACSLPLDDRQHVLERQRLEVQPVGGVVVGRHRLGVAVDHDRLEALVAQREGRVTAAVVELDALPDPVRPAAEDDDLLPRRRVGLALLLVGAVEIRRERLELRRARVDALVDRRRARARARSARGPPRRRCRGSCRARCRRSRRASACAAGPVDMPRSPTRLADRLQLDDLRELRQEPRVDLRQLVQLARPSSRDRARGTSPTCADRSARSAPAAAPPSSSSDAGDRRSVACRLAEQQTRSRRARASGTPS